MRAARAVRCAREAAAVIRALAAARHPRARDPVEAKNRGGERSLDGKEAGKSLSGCARPLRQDSLPNIAERAPIRSMASALTLVIGNKNYSSWSMRPWVALRGCGVAF